MFCPCSAVASDNTASHVFLKCLKLFTVTAFVSMQIIRFPSTILNDRYFQWFAIPMVWSLTLTLHLSLTLQACTNCNPLRPFEQQTFGIAALRNTGLVPNNNAEILVFGFVSLPLLKCICVNVLRQSSGVSIESCMTIVL